MTSAKASKPPSVLADLAALRRRRAEVLLRRDKIASARKAIEHKLSEHGRDRTAEQRQAARDLRASSTIEIDKRIASDRDALGELVQEEAASAFVQLEIDREIAALHSERRQDFVNVARSASSVDAEAGHAAADSLRDWLQARQANAGAWRQAWQHHGQGPMLSPGVRDPLHPETGGGNARIPGQAHADRLRLPAGAMRSERGVEWWDVAAVADALAAHLATGDGLPAGAVRDERQGKPSIYRNAATGVRREVSAPELAGDTKAGLRPNAAVIAAVTPDEFGFAEFVFLEPLPDDYEPTREPPMSADSQPFTLAAIGG